MSLLKIVILDDLDAPMIAGLLKAFLKAPGRTPALEMMRYSKFRDLPAVLRTRYDLAIFDYRDHQAEGQPGAVSAITYAATHPLSLVVLKSAFELGAADRDDVEQVQVGKILIATSQPNRSWDHALKEHTARWLGRGAAAASIRSRYRVIDGVVQDQTARDLALAARNFDDNWFLQAANEQFRNIQQPLLQALGEKLAARADLEEPAPGERSYLRVPVTAQSPWVPWELLMFEARRELSMPISYVVEVGRREPQAWAMTKLLYVNADGVGSDAERAAIKAALPWLPDLQIQEVSYKDFIAEDKVYEADIVHLGMHGPNTPDEDVSLAKQRPLWTTLITTRPKLLVFSACYGIQMLTNGARAAYPFPISALEELFDEGGIDTIVTSQFPLENDEMPPIWCKTFYAALGLTGDAAIAAGWARAEVAATLSQFFELATVVVSRRGSSLAVTEPPP